MSGGGMLAAFAVGLLGGVHCAGMCGGIAGALALGLAPEARARRERLLLLLAAYNLGRVAAYTLAGAAAGLLGMLAAAASASSGSAGTCGRAFARAWRGSFPCAACRRPSRL